MSKYTVCFKYYCFLDKNICIDHAENRAVSKSPVTYWGHYTRCGEYELYYCIFSNLIHTLFTVSEG